MKTVIPRKYFIESFIQKRFLRNSPTEWFVTFQSNTSLTEIEIPVAFRRKPTENLFWPTSKKYFCNKAGQKLLTHSNFHSLMS